MILPCFCKCHFLQVNEFRPNHKKWPGRVERVEILSNGDYLSECVFPGMRVCGRKLPFCQTHSL